MQDVSKIVKYGIVIGFFLMLGVACVSIVNRAGSVQRFSKGVESNLTGGLKRTVTLYDHNGNVIKQWNGKIDISEATDETDFIVDGRRIIIHGGITTIEEEK